MTFSKPKEISLTTIAKWVDSYINQTNFDNEEQLVEYLYHLFLHNARINNLFKDNNTYDDFTLYCVSKLLVRIHNKEKEQVKSIVNYIKRVLHPWYAEYIRCFCTGDPDFEKTNFDLNDFSDYLIDYTSEYDYKITEVGQLNISRVIIDYLKHIPYKHTSPEWSNICVSCLLTLNNRLQSAIRLITIGEDSVTLSKAIREAKLLPPVLFHIEDNRATYVSVLVNELIHVICGELSYSTRSFVSSSQCLKNLVMAANNDEDL